MSCMSFFAHNTVELDDGCKIGEGTKIWHFSHIMSSAIIGKGCTLGQNVYIAANVKIGDNVKIQNNVSIYEGVTCEDDVFIGPSAVFTNVINPRSAIQRKSEYKTTRIKKGATIGANATILCGIEIGEYSFVGAGAVLTKNVKNYALVMGNPARQTGWISTHGAKLAFDENGLAICSLSQSQYTLKNGKVTKA